MGKVTFTWNERAFDILMQDGKDTQRMFDESGRR